MAEVKINKKDLEKMLKEQLGCKKVVWDKDGNAVVDMDLEELKKDTTTIIKNYPIYVEKYKPDFPKPYINPGWTVTCSDKSNSMTFNGGN